MIRRPPRSTRTDTLLPYTTLFRSAPDSLAALLQAPVDEPGAMRADVTLTVALLRYLDHANNGRIRPSAAGWDVWFHPRSGFVVEAATALASGRLAAYLDQAGPPDRAYGALREVRARDRKSTRLNSSH